MTERKLSKVCWYKKTDALIFMPSIRGESKGSYCHSKSCRANKSGTGEKPAIEFHLNLCTPFLLPLVVREQGNGIAGCEGWRTKYNRAKRDVGALSIRTLQRIQGG